MLTFLAIFLALLFILEINLSNDCQSLKVGIKMAQFGNLNDHRLKVHGARFPSIVDYRNIVSMGKHPFAVNMEQSHSKKINK